MEKTAKGFTDFVTKEFMGAELLGSPEIDRELIRLKEAGLLVSSRATEQKFLDALMEELLGCTHQQRCDILRKTPTTLAALLLDRIHCGMNLVLSFAGRGVVFPSQGAPSQREFYEQLLMQQFK